jgi:hypothetical protein
MKISIFKNFNEVSAAYHRDVFDVLERIKVGKSKHIIDQIASTTDETKQKMLKNCLPAILFSGTFSQRNAVSIIEHSGLICLDFDKFDTIEQLSQYRQSFIDDKYTFSVFVSPRNNGLKVLVKIPKDIVNHKRYFEALNKYYNNPYFDIHCSDICRICFESYDPNIYINQESEVWTELIEEDIYEVTEEVRIPIKSDNEIISRLLKWFSKFSMASGERNANLFKLASALNDYGISKNEALRVCLQYQQKDFSEREIDTTVKSAYKKTASHHSKQFEDIHTKKRIEQQIRSGKDIKMVRKAFPELSETEFDSAVDNVRDNISVTDFWEYTNKGNVVVQHHKFKSFLQEHNFFKYYPSNAGFIFINIFENLIEETNKDKIKDFSLHYLENADNIGMKPFDYMAGNTKFFTYDYLSFLNTKEVNLLEDTVDTSYLYYLNKVVKVSKNKIDEIDYIDCDGYVWRNQIIQRDFLKVNDTDCVFNKFLFLVAGKEETRFRSIKSVIGYLLHSFKTSANNKAIILNDETISDTPNGGSGKGLFWNALSQMKKLNSLDGKIFSFNDQFKYQTVSTDSQILVFDDVKKHFDFESLFSLITEGITIERKGQLAIKLPVNKSPKILITTNYTVGGAGGSFDRRKFEIEFSSYFNAHHTPLQEFNHLLFDEWDSIEWNRFNNFMIECIQFYFEHGLIVSEFKNLELRKFITKTSNEFYEFTNDLENMPTNERIYSKKFHEDIINEYPDLRKWLTYKKLKMWVDQYALFYNKTIVFDRDVTGRYFEIKPSEPQHKKFVNPFGDEPF